VALFPTYSLGEISRLISEGKVFVTSGALQDAGAYQLTEEDICECILDHLSESDFYKTMPALHLHNRGKMQDVYHCDYAGVQWYIKLQIKNKQAVVISFKEK
jgi:hypothetical protein